MRFDLQFERTYPHPVAAVWRALTEREALAEWLMETDFVAEFGREFSLLCEGGEGAFRYRCRVLELEPGRRMLWSWVLAGRPEAGEMRVELTLEPVAGGTRLRIRHWGDRDAAAIDDFEGGWPGMLERLGAVVRERG